MSVLNKFLDKLSTNIKEEESAVVFSASRELSRQINWLLISVSAPFFFIFHFFGSPLLATLLIPIDISLAVGLILNRMGYYRLSNWICILTVVIPTTFYAGYAGKDYGFQNLFFCYITLPFVLFRPDQMVQRLSGVLCIGLPIFILEYFDYDIGFSMSKPIASDLIYNLLAVVSFIVIVLCIRFYYLMNTKSEEKLRTSNDNLKKTLIELRESQAYAEKMNMQAAMSSLSMGVAHEINNPLSIIDSEAENLLTSLWNPQVKEAAFEGCIPVLSKRRALMAFWQLEGVLDETHNFQENCDLEDPKFYLPLPTEYERHRGEIFDILFNFYRRHLAVKFAQLTRDNARRVSDVARTMLRYGMAESGKKQPMRVSAVFDDLKQILGGICRRKKIQLTIHYSDGDMMVKGDVVRLNQVFINLARNSFHALEKQAQIEGVGFEKKLCYTIYCQPNLEVEGRKDVIFEIFDNGCGMPEEEAEKIFDPFFSTKDTSGGENIGLGLAILHRIVTDHEGTISVSSSTGKGTLFRMILPLYESEDKVSI